MTTMHPTYLITPDPKGHKANVLWLIGQAHVLKYEGVCFGIGTSGIQNPITTDWGDFSECVRKAASLGMKLRIRGGTDIPCYSYAGGQQIGPSYWSVQYNNGLSWPQPYRAPVAVLIAWAHLVLGKAWTLAHDIYVAAGLDPLKMIQVAVTNENGLGGACGPYLGKYSEAKTLWDKFLALWKQYGLSKDATTYSQARNVYLQILPMSFWPEGSAPRLGGYIEDSFFRNLEVAIGKCGIPDEVVWPFTLEMQYASDGIAELSRVASQGATIMSKYPRIFVNRYTPASSSPQEAADLWDSRWLWAEHQIETAMPGVEVEVMEAGLVAENAPSLQLAQCRNAQLARMRTRTAGGIFIGMPTNALGKGYNLWNPDQSVVNGLVGPAKAG